MSLVRIIVALLAFALAIPAMAEDITFAGLVTYRERMSLPSNATLTITLVNLPGEHRIAGANASLGGKAGSPIQFTLNVRSDVIAAGGQYGLVAEISSGDHVVFRNTQPALVDVAEPEGNVIEVEFFPPPPHDPAEQVTPPVEAPDALLDVLWMVTSIGGEPVLPQTEVTFSIASDHRAGGNGGCNNYFTEASFGAPPLAFGPIAGTRMACDGVVLTQEARFFAALGATAGYDLVGDTLKLVDAAGIPLAGLVRSP